MGSLTRPSAWTDSPIADAANLSFLPRPNRCAWSFIGIAGGGDFLLHLMSKYHRTHITVDAMRRYTKPNPLVNNQYSVVRHNTIQADEK